MYLRFSLIVCVYHIITRDTQCIISVRQFDTQGSQAVRLEFIENFCLMFSCKTCKILQSRVCTFCISLLKKLVLSACSTKQICNPSEYIHL